MAEIKFEIVKHIGVLSEGNNGWKKELNLVHITPNMFIRGYFERTSSTTMHYEIVDIFGNNGPRFEGMGKGITLSEDEIQNLVNLMNNN